MSQRRFAIVCPGQGSQRHGMLDAIPDVEGMDRLIDASEALSGLDLRTIAARGAGEQLADTLAAQPLLFLTDWAWGTALLAAGARPEAAAGHSLGEFAALALAGAFSVEAGLELVVERSRLMAQCARNAPGGMVAVIGMDAADVSRIADSVEGVWVANDNAPGQVVLSGTHAGIATVSTAISEAGARRVVPLNVAGAFHSPLMEPAADAFAAVLDQATFVDSQMPVWQNADPTPATGAKQLRARLRKQITSPVRWTETMIGMRDAGIDAIVEAGPGQVLKGLAKRVDGLSSYSCEEDGTARVLEEVSQ